MVSIRAVQRLCNAGIILAVMVILMGGWTRIMDAGLGCPDWPGCFGQLIVPVTVEQIQQAEINFAGQVVDQEKGWIEMIHRYMAATLGLVIMILAWFGWKQRKEQHYPSALSLLLLGLVILQGIFGMWTVTLKLMPQIVTIHLLGGLLTLSLLVLLKSRIGESGMRAGNKAGSLMMRLAVLILFIQILLGGWTSANYAGWACNHWLGCLQDQQVELDYHSGFSFSLDSSRNYQGGVLTHQARAAIQMTHRVGAVITMFVLMAVVLACWSYKRCVMPAMILLSLLAIQLVLGVLNVVYGVPVLMAILHHGVAVLLLLSLLWLKQRYEMELGYANS